jgi:hypothetical protein
MKKYEFEVEIQHSIKASNLNDALEILNEKLKVVPFQIKSVTFGMDKE